ncbi:MAG: Na/Pi symporter [Firmicutes bacterium]|nr:Na/Pi symporter [Bacillota bacterium]
MVLLLSAIGLFLVGILIFCDTLGKFSSNRLKSYLRICDNRFAGIGIGAGVTAIVNSSTATSVMIIGLVNAGVLTLFQATSLIMGANVGATVTGLLISLSSFNIKYIFMLLIFVGAILKLISKKKTITILSDFFIGLGIMFIAMEVMNFALEDKNLRNFFSNIFGNAHFPFYLLLLGVLLTCIVQSSMVALALLVCMMGNGLVSLEQAMFVIMGANVGMCLAVYLASLGGTINAKRTAVIHFLFNAIGAVFFTFIVWTFSNILITPFERINFAWQLSVFNVAFNVATALLLVVFIKPLVKLSSWLVPL